MTARRGRPPKPPDEVRTVRVTVLLTEREHATLLRACGGRGESTLLREAGLREAEAMKPEVMERVERMRGSGATLAGAMLDGATPERLAWLGVAGSAGNAIRAAIAKRGET